MRRVSHGEVLRKMESGRKLILGIEISGTHNEDLENLILTRDAGG